nr:MAG TPA: septicolysin [Caudoviricetes sp.]
MRKMTKKRLLDAIDNTKFITLTTGTSKKTREGEIIEEFEANAKAAYQRIVALVSNYGKLSRRIALANVGETTETISGEPTVSDIMIQQQRDKFSERVLDVFKTQYSSAKRDVDYSNESLFERLDRFLTSMTGGEKNKLFPKEVEELTETFRRQNELRLVDPLKLITLIPEAEKKLEESKAEVDSLLDELNARIVIEIDLNEV